MAEDKVSLRANTSVDIPSQKVNIRGLSEIPMHLFPLPIIKVIHPTTKGAVDAQGKNVAVGQFFNTGTREVYGNQVEFYLLRSKPTTRIFNDLKTREDQEKEGFLVLGALKTTLDPFLMWVSGTSFWSFRQLLGQLRGLKVKDAWEYAIKVVAEEQEGDFGRYLRLGFTIDQTVKVDEETYKKLEELFYEWGASLNENDGTVEEKESPVEGNGIPVQDVDLSVFDEIPS